MKLKDGDLMKKFFLVVCICFLLVGCGKYTGNDAAKDLENKLEDVKAYNLTGILEITNNEDVYKYDVDVSYKKDDKFKVSLKNKTNNHEQIILKNTDGVYVLTPSLNKSFKFQSDWPYNNSQTYLLQTLLSDIQNDKNKKFKEITSSYIFETTVNYPNNTDLVKQKIYFDKKLNPKKVEVFDKEGNVLIKMTFNKVDLKAKFKSNHFALDAAMKTAKAEDTSTPVSKIDAEIYPMYVPENTTLTDREVVKTDSGQRIIMTYGGDNPFMMVQQTAPSSEEHTVVSMLGEPVQLASSVAAVSDNMISWVSNGIEYYVIADNMSKKELTSVASSLQAMPVSK